MLCPAAVTNPDADFGPPKHIALIGRLAEGDRLITSGHTATLAKIAALRVVCVGHGPHRSGNPRSAASHEHFAPLCELLHRARAAQPRRCRRAPLGLP